MTVIVQYIVHVHYNSVIVQYIVHVHYNSIVYAVIRRGDICNVYMYSEKNMGCC